MTDREVRVAYPEMRARLRQAVSSLCNQQFQQRLWINGHRESRQELGFVDTILVLVDEMEMFSDRDLIGDVLTDESELAAFQSLRFRLSSLVEAIGPSGSFADALASGRWDSCVAGGREMQRQMDKMDRKA